MTLLDYLLDVDAAYDFANSFRKWHAGQPVNERCHLGDQGIQDDVLMILKKVYDYVGVDKHNAHYPTKEKVQARPAYECLLGLYMLLNGTHVGPTHFWSLFYAVDYTEPNLDWRLHVDVNEWANQPDDATRVEIEVCTRDPNATLPTGSGQRFFVDIDNSPQQGQNVLEVAADQLVSYRARFVDAAGTPLSLWSYSNEELPFDIAIPPLIPADYPAGP